MKKVAKKTIEKRSRKSKARRKGSGPGKSYRKGLSILALMQQFPDEYAAERWFEEARWGKHLTRLRCPRCLNWRRVKEAPGRQPMPYRCGSCNTYFSVRTCTALADTKVSYQKWLIAIYLFTTNVRGISSMRLRREIDVTQRTAWFMLHRMREAFRENAPIVDSEKFKGPVEVDETFVCGSKRWMHWSRKKHLPRGPQANKLIVIGMRDRKTNRNKTKVIKRQDRETFHAFVKRYARKGAIIYTDEAKGYKGLRNHYSVCHKAHEYVDGPVHVQGVECHWSHLKRGIRSTYVRPSKRHYHRYLREFSGRHNIRHKDTLKQMRAVVRGMVGRRLFYRELTKNKKRR